MADISMCVGTGCPLASECYRHTAPQNQHWQTFFTFVPYDHPSKSCEMFWDNMTKSRKEEPMNE